MSGSDILFSTKAADKVAALIAEEGNHALNLRVAISGGGCSGFLYNFTLDESVNFDDTVITQSGSSSENKVKLLIDSISWQYLKGAEIDYLDDIEGTFVVRNPNAKTTCGCGSSFSLDNDE